MGEEWLEKSYKLLTISDLSRDRYMLGYIKERLGKFPRLSDKTAKMAKALLLSQKIYIQKG